MATIAAIAKQDRQQVSHFSRNLSLAFLAPDITEMILTGRQPITLTPERLKAARPLPLDWTTSRMHLWASIPLPAISGRSNEPSKGNSSAVNWTMHLLN